MKEIAKSHCRSHNSVCQNCGGKAVQSDPSGFNQPMQGVVDDENPEESDSRGEGIGQEVPGAHKEHPESYCKEKDAHDSPSGSSDWTCLWGVAEWSGFIHRKWKDIFSRLNFRFAVD